MQENRDWVYGTTIYGKVLSSVQKKYSIQPKSRFGRNFRPFKIQIFARIFCLKKFHACLMMSENFQTNEKVVP